MPLTTAAMPSGEAETDQSRPRERNRLRQLRLVESRTGSFRSSLSTSDERRECAETETVPAECPPRRFPICLLSAGVLISWLLGFAVWVCTEMLIASLIAAWLSSSLIILLLGALFGARLSR